MQTDRCRSIIWSQRCNSPVEKVHAKSLCGNALGPTVGLGSPVVTELYGVFTGVRSGENSSVARVPRFVTTGAGTAAATPCFAPTQACSARPGKQRDASLLNRGSNRVLLRRDGDQRRPRDWVRARPSANLDMGSGLEGTTPTRIGPQIVSGFLPATGKISSCPRRIRVACGIKDTQQTIGRVLLSRCHTLARP